MTLSTTPSSAAVAAPVNVAADLCAVVCAGSAGVHAALVVPHARESAAMAVAFGLAAVTLAVAAAGEGLAPSRATGAAASALLLGVALSYVLSRTTGIPGLTVHIEPFDTLGTLVSSLEVVAAMVTVRQLIPWRH